MKTNYIWKEMTAEDMKKYRRSKFTVQRKRGQGPGSVPVDKRV